MESKSNNDSSKTKKRYFFINLGWTFHSFFNRILSFFEKKEDGVLLLLPARLDGSFGDELMAVTFVKNIEENTQITMYERKLHERPDLFGNRENINYLKYKFAPKFHKNRGGAYILGADNLTPSYGTAGTSFKCRTLRHANAYDIPTGILGFSLNEGILNSPLKKDFVSLLPETQFKLRDPDSYEVANRFLPSENLYQVSDLAFLCPYDKNEDTQYLNWISERRKEAKVIGGICPNWMQAHKVGVEAYINQFVLVFEKLHHEKNVSYVLLYHDIRGEMNDRDLSEEINLRLKKKNIDCFFKSDIKNGLELKSYLEFIDFTISARMHFGISGYSFAKPMFGISYEDKFSGLQKLFGVDPKKSLISYMDMTKFYEVLETFIDHLPQFSETTKGNLSKVMELSRKNFDQLNK